MNALRILLCVAISAIFVSQTIGCRKRSKPDPSAVTPSETPAAAAAPAPAATPDLPPASLPTGAGTTLAPSVGGDPDKETVKTQSRFDRNAVWMAKLGKNEPQLRAQVLAEIQRAGLSPAELQELRKQAQMYGIKL